MTNFDYRKAQMTKADLTKLKKNHEESQYANLSDQRFDPKPVVKLFDCAGASTWLITECDDDGYAFGLCDLGWGQPELGYVHIPELIEALGWRLNKDRWFTADKTLSGYAEVARENQRIVS
tara:strand:- start:357 stop:719 length:363 start_codon:yes stop_codon:yes gene_type:complete